MLEIKSNDASLIFGADTTFTMPNHDVVIDVEFKPFYNITPNPANPKVCVTDAYGNQTCPVDSVFEGESVNIVDVVKPTTGFTLKDIKIYKEENIIIHVKG